MTIGRIPSVEGGIQPTIVDAKGDLIVATAADTVNRLAVGTNGHVLVADSAATTGLKWQGFVGCSATITGSNQSVNNATWTAINYNAEDFDTDSFHDTSSNNTRITIPSGKAGKYLFRASISLTANNTTGRRIASFYKNGTVLDRFYIESTPANGVYISMHATGIMDLAVGDYIEVYIYQSGGVTDSIAAAYSNFQCEYLGV